LTAARIGAELIANRAPGLGIDLRWMLARLKLTLVNYRRERFSAGAV
jgi:hypothetical protein